MIQVTLGIGVGVLGKPRASGDDPYARILTRLAEG